MAVVNGEPEASAEARPPTYGTGAVVEGDFHQVYENLYFLLAKCMTKREKQQQQQQQEAEDSATRERTKDKQLQTAWLYKQDLFVNPSRASSWAALGKHYAQELEQLLDAALPWQPCQDVQLRARVAKVRAMLPSRPSPLRRHGMRSSPRAPHPPEQASKQAPQSAHHQLRLQSVYGVCGVCGVCGVRCAARSTLAARSGAWGRP